MITRPRATFAVLSLLLLASACSSSTTTAPDAGTSPADAAALSCDAGASMDATAPADVGPAPDAGPSPDGGPDLDAASPLDAGAPPDASAPQLVTLTTTMGAIELELDPNLAPIGTANFLSYVDQQFYDGTIFHRVIADFMIQGGGYTEDFSEKTTADPIKNEAGNGLKNVRGTVAYARTDVVDSATSQFFINVVDNDFLDHQDETAAGFGYAVFGKVVAGMDVVDAIAAVQTTNYPWASDVPVTPVVITTARRK